MKPHPKLKNPEACRTCAMCCKVFTFYDHDSDGFVERVRLLKTDKIKIEKTNLASPEGQRLYRVIIDIPCSALELKDGKYFCKLFGKRTRPLMCNQYPYDITDWEERYCKALK
ncbi:MAG: YkgJ family cysteine cluster protein [Nanoarchaeota archaeon]